MNREAKLQALSMEYKVNFNTQNHSQEKKPKPVPRKINNKPPRITRLLALAHHLQDLLGQGVLADYADIARLSNLSRPRITQIMNLTLLSPDIQEEILGFSELSAVSIKEQDLRRILHTPVWQEQWHTWKEIKAANPLSL